MMCPPFRILHIIGTTGPSGVFSFVMNYYRHMDRNIVQFDFFVQGERCRELEEEISDLGGKVFGFPHPMRHWRKNMAVFNRTLKEGKYSVVHSHMNTLSAIWLREAQKAGVPVRIAHNHSVLVPGEWLRNFAKLVLRPHSRRYATHHYACSEYSGRWLFGDKAFEAGEVSVIKNALDLGTFSLKSDTRVMLRRSLALENKLVVGSVGRLVPGKNYLFLLDIFACLSRLEDNARLLLIGGGEMKGRLAVRARELGLLDKIIFTGAVQNVPALLSAMDVFVFPSKGEGLGLAMMEAQAAGLPCLASQMIPSEACLTPLVKVLSLYDVPKNWAEATLQMAGIVRKNGDFRQLLENAGYNILKAAPLLQKAYEGHFGVSAGDDS